MQKITVIDDDPVVLTLVQEFLESQGYQVNACSDARAALKAILAPQSEHPDLLMIDMLMPDLTGWEVIDSLKNDQRAKSIPIVMLSANPISETFGTAQGKPHQADHYLEKPFNFDTLRALLNSLVNKLGD